MPVEGEPFFARTGLALRPGQESASGAIPQLRDAVTKLVKWSGGNVFVSKRISHNWRISALAEAFPSAQFVHLVRDGRAVTASLNNVDWWPEERLWWAGDVTPAEWLASGKGKWDAAARTWVEELNQIAHGTQPLEPSRVLTVRYEDFVAEPTSQLRMIADFAGLSARPLGWEAALDQVQFPNRNARWPEVLGDAVVDVEEIQHDYLVSFGYSLRTP